MKRIGTPRPPGCTTRYRAATGTEWGARDATPVPARCARTTIASAPARSDSFLTTNACAASCRVTTAVIPASSRRARATNAGARLRRLPGLTPSLLGSAGESGNRRRPRARQRGPGTPKMSPARSARPARLPPARPKARTRSGCSGRRSSPASYGAESPAAKPSLCPAGPASRGIRPQPMPVPSYPPPRSLKRVWAWSRCRSHAMLSSALRGASYASEAGIVGLLFWWLQRSCDPRVARGPGRWQAWPGGTAGTGASLGPLIAPGSAHSMLSPSPLAIRASRHSRFATLHPYVFMGRLTQTPPSCGLGHLSATACHSHVTRGDRKPLLTPHAR
jgi:hypothetical protein